MSLLLCFVSRFWVFLSFFSTLWSWYFYFKIWVLLWKGWNGPIRGGVISWCPAPEILKIDLTGDQVFFVFSSQNPCTLLVATCTLLVVTCTLLVVTCTLLVVTCTGFYADYSISDCISRRCVQLQELFISRRPVIRRLISIKDAQRCSVWRREGKKDWVSQFLTIYTQLVHYYVREVGVWLNQWLS